ncbi:MAG TPA: STAS domain-containing protein [Candidatus Eremiobacteraceae bacterium]|nr:STAS domain-containing protein [Candidatus Eremiobacteraceae bacterium]
MTDQASFQLQVIDGTAVLAITGEIDIANIVEFKAFAGDAARNDDGPVIVSFEKVTYLDSHTLEALVDLSKRLRTNRRRLLVVAPNESPAGRIMRTTGIELALALFETVDDALQGAKQG